MLVSHIEAELEQFLPWNVILQISVHNARILHILPRCHPNLPHTTTQLASRNRWAEIVDHKGIYQWTSQLKRAVYSKPFFSSTTASEPTTASIKEGLLYLLFPPNILPPVVFWFRLRCSKAYGVVNKLSFPWVDIIYYCDTSVRTIGPAISTLLLLSIVSWE